jgi:hypothetical protein
MKFSGRRVWVPLGLATLLVLAWQAQGWAGVALVSGGVVMWGLLHFYRMTTVLRRAAGRPVGWVDSAVMLQARLQPGNNLLHVLALTRALGQQQPDDRPDTEVYRWTDNGGATVTCTFVQSRLASWTFERPPADPEPSTTETEPASADPTHAVSQNGPAQT